MQNPTDYIIPILVLAVAIAIRVKRSFGFHKYRRVIPWFRILICAAILVVIFGFGIHYHPNTVIINAGGVLVGLGLSYIGMKSVVVEQREDGIYYKAHVWIEVGILIIFFIRLSMRFYKLYGAMGNLPPEQIANQLRYEKDPVTGIIISVFSTYYIYYFSYISAHVIKLRRANTNL